MEIVLDKSYLEAKPGSEVEALCRANEVLFLESLFFELMTTSEAQRIRCFSKLLFSPNPVLLIPRPGPLVRREVQAQTAAHPLSAHRIKEQFSFNPRLAEPGFRIAPEHAEILRKWGDEVQQDVYGFHDLATGVAAWCPEIRSLTGEELRRECEDLKRQAGENPEIVRAIYRSLGLDGFPDPDVLTLDWVTFRNVQAKVLFFLDHVARYGFSDPGSPKRIEHDVHDLDYAILGAVAGALATCDKQLATNFRFMCPAGILLR